MHMNMAISVYEYRRGEMLTYTYAGIWENENADGKGG